jgi:putative hemolysin
MVSLSSFRTERTFLFVLFVLVLALMPTLALAQDATPVMSDAAAYCEEQGGTLVTRYPASSTNNPDTIVRFAGSVDFCEWNDVEEAGIASLPVDVLYADLPTLAAMFYLNPPTFEPGRNPSANPSYLYCDQLGGAINFGAVNASGSGWVNETDTGDVISVCVFADGSMIESFTVFYKSDGTVRGADLTERFRWSE